MDESASPADLDLLVRLGAAMTAAGESIDEVTSRLDQTGCARGLRHLSIVVLPTAIFVQAGHGSATYMRMDGFPNEQLRLDQVSALYDLVERAGDVDLAPLEGIAEADRIMSEPPSIGPRGRTLGLGLLSAGFSLLLQPTLVGLVIAFLLGLAVGLARLLRMPSLQAIFPVLATFVVSLVVFATAAHFEVGNPIRTLIPPLVVFLPGAVLTTGMRDLAAGQVISGASRLVQGVVNLGLLAFGVVAAATLVELPQTELIDGRLDRLGWWAPWVALVLVTLGTHLHHCAPRRSLLWIFAVLVVAYGAQTVSAAALSAELSPFFGALAMTPVVLGFEQLDGGPPSLVTFLPAFWLLVPGAAGLIGFTEMVGTTSALGLDDFTESLGTVIEISLGVLIGAAAFRAVSRVAPTGQGSRTPATE